MACSLRARGRHLGGLAGDRRARARRRRAARAAADQARPACRPGRRRPPRGQVRRLTAPQLTCGRPVGGRDRRNHRRRDTTVRPRLSFANVTSMLALFVALGGTSYAAVTLKSNSVNKSHLRTNSVGKSEIRARAVGRSEVGSNAIGASELRTSAVGSNDVRDETLGANDLTPAARAALNGVTFRASATAAGGLTAGNVRRVAQTATGGYTVETRRH